MLPPGILIFDELGVPERNSGLDGLCDHATAGWGCFLGRVLVARNPCSLSGGFAITLRNSNCR